MANAIVYVKAEDSNGKMVVNKPITTMANGFFELWLPRDQNIKVTIKGYGKTATGMVGTFANSKTCLTNFHLQ